MQDADRTIHKKHNGCSVAAERPESLSAFLGTLAADKSHIQTIQHFKLVHSSSALNYNATDFHGASEMYRIHLLKKKHLLDFVGVRRPK